MKQIKNPFNIFKKKSGLSRNTVAFGTDFGKKLNSNFRSTDSVMKKKFSYSNYDHPPIPISDITFEKISKIMNTNETKQTHPINNQFTNSENTIVHLLMRKEEDLINQVLDAKEFNISEFFDPNLVNARGETIFKLAIKNKSLSDEIIRKLLSKFNQEESLYPFLDIADKNGITAFVQLFISKRSTELIEWVIKEFDCDANQEFNIKLGGKLTKLKNILFYLIHKSRNTKKEAVDRNFEHFKAVTRKLAIFENISMILTKNIKELKVFGEIVEINAQNEEGNTILHELSSQLMEHGMKKKKGMYRTEFNALKELNETKRNFFLYLLQFKTIDFQKKNNQYHTVQHYLVQKKEFDVAEMIETIEKKRKFVPFEKKKQKFQLKETAKTKKKNSFHYKKAKIIEELINTESTYVETISHYFSVYFEPLLEWKKSWDYFKKEYLMKNEKNSKKIMSSSTEKIIKEIMSSQIFQVINSMKCIIEINSKLFESIKKTFNGEPVFEFSDIMEREIYKEFSKAGEFGKQIEYYIFYSQMNKSSSTLCGKSKELEEYFQTADQNERQLDSFLILPIQRPPRYRLFTKDLIKNYKKFDRDSSYTFKLLSKSNKYIEEFVAKIDNRRTDLLKQQCMIQISKYLNESHKFNILQGKRKNLIFFGMEGLTCIDSSYQPMKSFRLFIFDSLIAISFKEKGKNKKTLVTFDGIKEKLSICIVDLFSVQFLIISIFNGEKITYFNVKVEKGTTSFLPKGIHSIVQRKDEFTFGNNFLIVNQNEETQSKIEKFLTRQPFDLTINKK